MFLFRMWVVVVAVSLTNSLRSNLGSECIWNAPCDLCLNRGCFFVVPHTSIPICVKDWRPFKGQIVTILTPGSQVACSRQPTPVPDPTLFPVPTEDTEPTDGPSSGAASSSTQSPGLVPAQNSGSSSPSWPLLLLIVVLVLVGALGLIAGGLRVWKWRRGRQGYRRYFYQTGVFEGLNRRWGRGRINPNDLANVEVTSSSRPWTSGSPVSTFNNPAFRPPQNTIAISPILPSSASVIYSPLSVQTVSTSVPYEDVEMSESSSPIHQNQPDPTLLAPAFPTTGSSNSSEILLDLSSHNRSDAAAALNTSDGNAEDENELEEIFLDSMEEQQPPPPPDSSTSFRVWSSQHPSLRAMAIPPPPPRQSRRLIEKRRSEQQ